MLWLSFAAGAMRIAANGDNGRHAQGGNCSAVQREE